MSGGVFATVAAGGGTTPTGTGVRKVVGGVENAAASLVLNADVDPVAAIAGTKVAPDFGAANITTTGAALLDATPRATVGSGRLPNVASAFARNVGNTGDQCVFKATSLNELIFGADDAFATPFSVTRVWGDTAVFLGVGAGGGAVNYLRASAGSLQAGFPVIGLATPYGVHGKIDDATAPPFTVAAATYQNEAIKLTNAGAGTVTFPTATDATAYTKTIINTGAGTKTIQQAAGLTVGLATGLAGRFLFDAAGVHLVGATVAWV